MQMKFRMFLSINMLFFIVALVHAEDWTHWRGPHHNGVSDASHMISSWSVDGENLIWRAEFCGRSTPIVMNGKVYVTGRSGDGIDKQEHIACFDAETGQLLWEHFNSVSNTAVPHKRVSWASPAGDPETGNVYVIGANGLFQCFSESGKVLWYRNMTDEFNVTTGFGGRTVTPVVDEDLVIIAFVSSGWGKHGLPALRYFAFEKRTGEIRWIAAPGGRFTNPNIYSTPVVAVINGERMLIGGNADGNVYAMKVRTGEKIWQFDFGKRGLHASVVVDGNIVYAAHGEENRDTPIMGRVVAIDATGTGNVTKTHELWRIDGAEVGYTSLLVKDGRLYFVDNSANLYAVDGKTGKQFWQHSLGTVGKASPVWADGKIYYPEVNGRFHILQPGDTSCVELDNEKITMADGRYAELYGSPAVAYERLYFASENGVFCLGNKKAKYQAERGKMDSATDWKAAKGAAPAYLQLVPADVTIQAGDAVSFRARILDDKRRFISEVTAEWQLGDLRASMSDGQVLRTTPETTPIVKVLEASYQGLKGTVRLRILSPLPTTEDFETYAPGENPPFWLGGGSANSPATKFIVTDLDGNKVLNKPVSQRGVQRGEVYIGMPNLKNYTIQADVLSEQIKRKLSNPGLINSGYTFEVIAPSRKLEIFSWISERRMAKEVPFQLEGDTWYTMKLQVDNTGANAIVRGKIWKKDAPEPESWTITAEDPHPVREGSPGIYGFTKTNLYYDNIKITKNGS